MLDALDKEAAGLLRRVGDRVLAARKARRLSRRALSDLSGVSPRYLAQIEGGDGNVSIVLLQKVARALDQSVDALIRDEASLDVEAAAVLSDYMRADPATRSNVRRLLDPATARSLKAERICLIGLRGAGKSTLGPLLASDLGLPFLELVDAIERNVGMPTAEIIALYGQEGYRQLEASALEGIVADHDRLVLTAAGGVVEDKATFDIVLRRFHTLWLKASPPEHMERVRAQGDTRPMAGNPQAMRQLMQILKAREASYRRADLQFDTHARTVAGAREGLKDLVLTADVLSSSAGVSLSSRRSE